MSALEIRLNGLRDTQRFAAALAACEELPLVVALSGTLGAGKTQLVRFAAESLGVPPEDVTSPTYVLLQRYRGRQLIYHLDFYRLESAAEVWDLGIDEWLEQEALLFVEWAEKFPQCLPSDRLHVQLEPVDSAAADCRFVRVTASGVRSEKSLAQLVQRMALSPG